MNQKELQHAAREVPPMKDLFVLVADKDAKETIHGILERRYKAIGIRPITFDCVTHNRHDPGCVTQAQTFLGGFRQSCQYALVILDHEGSGRESQSREALEREIVASLDVKYWHKGCIEAIVIKPELEAWVWSNSPHVASVLDWDTRERKQSIKEWIVRHKPEYWALNDEKPIRPKETMEEILFQTRRGKSSSVFRELSETVSLKRCTDPAFNKLVDTLQLWFPAK